jgi:hypothetical protein
MATILALPVVLAAEPVHDELEPVADPEAAKLRALALELVDDAEEWLAIVADGEASSRLHRLHHNGLTLALWARSAAARPG